MSPVYVEDAKRTCGQDFQLRQEAGDTPPTSFAMPDCFISYSTQNETFARTVHHELVANGLDVFLASISLKPGDPWTAAIQTALRQSDWVIFLASKHACESPYVQQELGRAMAGSKKLVPVVWDMPPAELPGWVSQHQALDLRDATIEEIAERIKEIAVRIKQDKSKGVLIGLALIGAFLFAISQSE